MLTRLALTDVRNHVAADLAVSGGFVVLAGANGAGKTNVLEAVSLLAPGRGLRRAALSQVARDGGPGGFAVSATLTDGTVIGTGARADAPERRVVRINGAAAAAAALAEWSSITWLTPAMDRLFVEPAGERRRFLDRMTLALLPAHAHHALRYEGAMRARNRLLADDGAPDAAWLASLEAQMAEHGGAIRVARAMLVEALDARLETVRLAVAGGDDGDLARALADGRRRDAAAGRTLAGPHRDDLSVIHVAKAQPAARASTGEQKAMLFAIVLAHARLVAERVGRPPILLLDEVAAHLDPARRATLFADLAGVGQVWMTGTEPALFSALPGDATMLRVDDGAITRD